MGCYYFFKQKLYGFYLFQKPRVSKQPPASWSHLFAPATALPPLDGGVDMETSMPEGVSVTHGRPEGDRNGHVGGGAYGYPYAPTLSGSPISLGAGGGGGGGGGGIGGVSLHGFLLWGIAFV